MNSTTDPGALATAERHLAEVLAALAEVWMDPCPDRSDRIGRAFQALADAKEALEEAKSETGSTARYLRAYETAILMGLGIEEASEIRDGDGDLSSTRAHLLVAEGVLRHSAAAVARAQSRVAAGRSGSIREAQDELKVAQHHLDQITDAGAARLPERYRRAWAAADDLEDEIAALIREAQPESTTRSREFERLNQLAAAASTGGPLERADPLALLARAICPDPGDLLVGLVEGCAIELGALVSLARDAGDTSGPALAMIERRLRVGLELRRRELAALKSGPVRRPVAA